MASLPPTRSAPDLEVVLASALRDHAGRPGGLLPLFHALQDALGYVPPEALPRIAEALNLSRADVHGVLTFYHDFRTAPPGRRVVKLCRAEACQAVGCETVAEHLQAHHGVAFGETRQDGALTLEAVYCLGNCALGPSALVDGRLHGRVSPARLDALLTETAGPS